MGWASGSGLMSDIIGTMKKEIKDKAIRQRVYEILIPAFEGHDCDTLYECCDDDKVFKLVFEKTYPPEDDA